jgi:glycosyltransferase involved in cell wall biosynthesis
MKRIYVNGRFLCQPLTGVQRFAFEIVKELNKSTEIDLILLKPKALSFFELEGLSVHSFGNLSNHLWEQIELPAFLKKNQSKLLVNLTNTAPLLYQNQVVAIHDLAFLHNPKWFSFAFRTFYKFLIPIIAKNARHLLTVSEFSKSEISQRLGVSPNKISVIYNSVPSDFHHKEKIKNDKQEEYILAVGSLDPRKNLNTLIKAFNSIKGTRLKLYVIGSTNPKIFKTELPDFDEEKIKFLGRISDEKLVSLYANAKMFIYPTLYEGFGIPNIEAMYFSVPVITSDIPVTREVCKDAAYYINPLDINAIQEAILTLERDETLLKTLSAKGKEISNSYTWEEASVKLLEVIEHVSE